MSNFKVIRPQAKTNYIKDASQEGGVDTFTTGGSNVIARATDESYFGRYSAKCTWVDNLKLAESAAFTVTLPGTYLISAFVLSAKLLSTSGGKLQVVGNNFGGSSISIVDTLQDTAVPLLTDPQWVQIYSILTIAGGDKTGNIAVEIDASGWSDDIWVDGMQCEKILDITDLIPTTFIDGFQPGCSWVDGIYGYAERSALTREGGQIIDLVNYGMYIDQTSGIGMPPVENLSTEKILGHGHEHQKSRFRVPTFNIIPKLLADTEADLRTKRQSLISDFGPVWHDGSAIKLRYDADDGLPPRDILCRYSKGLETRKVAMDGFNELIGLQLVADTPFWTEEGHGSSDLDHNDTVTSRLVALRNVDESVWDMLGPPNALGTYTRIRAIIEIGEYIYIGGHFLNFDNIANADYVARYNTITQVWSQLPNTGGNIDAEVWDFEVSADQNILYIAGFFESVDSDTDLSWIIGLNITTGAWVPLGNITATTLGEATCLQFDHAGNLWAGGLFENLEGDANADGIAYWDGTSWNAAGTGWATGGGSGFPLDIGLDQTTGDIYVVGVGTTKVALNSDSIVRWDGSAWNGVGGGASGGDISSIYIDKAGIVYVGGTFTSLGSESFIGFGAWTGSAWTQVGGGVAGGTNPVLSIQPWKNGILVSGEFTSAGGDPEIIGKAVWNGSSWNHIDFGIPVGVIYKTLETVSNGIAIGGTWSAANIQHSGKATIDNVGTAVAYPIVHVKWVSGGTSAKWKWLGNHLVDANIWLDYALLEGEEMIIDFRPDFLEMRSTKFGKRWQLMPSSEIGEFVLWPGDNVITAYVELGGSPTIDAWIEWDVQYLGTD